MALSQSQPIFLHQLQQDLITYDPYKEFPSATGPILNFNTSKVSSFGKADY